MKRHNIVRGSSHSCSGFTLIELLIASVVTVAILGVAGYGLIAMLGSKNKADASAVQRSTLNYALKFISNEVRSASHISPSGNTSMITSFPPLSAGSQVILVLTIPNFPEPVVYYISSAQAPWLGPNNIFRWGPDLNADGSYNTTSYNSNVLVDSINVSGENTTCDGGLTALPPLADRQGFYACIDPSGKVADVYFGSVFTDRAGKSSSYRITSRMKARSILKLPSS